MIGKEREREGLVHTMSNLAGQGDVGVERKYDDEYCHTFLNTLEIKIFSKSDSD